MSKLEQIEKQIDAHIKVDCVACRNSIQSVTAPACPILLELNREARDAYRKASKSTRYHASVARHLS